MLRKSIIASQLALLLAAPVGLANAADANAITIPAGTGSIRGITADPNVDTNWDFDPDSEYASIDGSGNNLADPGINATLANLRRITPVTYDDGVSALPTGRPNPRTISENLHAQGDIRIPSVGNASDLIWQFAQLLDHDIGLTEGIASNAFEPVIVPAGDSFFAEGTVLPLHRAIFNSSTGTGTDNPRQQENEITGWIDASFVYGSDDIRAAALRTLDGTGKLKTSAGNLMPFNVDNLPNGNGVRAPEELFLAGDVRANEQPGLAAIHTIFVREHNRLAEIIAAENPELSGEDIYQKARALVAGMTQRIVYNEFVPLLIGKNTLSRYKGYDPLVDASMINEFSHAAYRVGHTMLSPTILRLDANGNEIAEGHLPLFAGFFNIETITQQGGIDPILRGLANQVSQNVDLLLIDDVRNLLFGNADAGGMGMDLAVLNIQRGRDHGLGTLNDVRVALGLKPYKRFGQISSDRNVRRALRKTYGRGNVDDIDLFTGVLAEDLVPGALVGETQVALFKLQFEALRDGDRFYWRNQFKGPENKANRKLIRSTTLSKLITRNTDIKRREIGRDAFVVGDEKITVN